jgi:prevent-host-death family protein
MKNVISATTLVRRLGDVLGRVRYRGEAFVIERNGNQVARLIPATPSETTSVRDALRTWREAGDPDPEFAADLDRVGAADREPADPWAS